MRETKQGRGAEKKRQEKRRNSNGPKEYIFPLVNDGDYGVLNTQIKIATIVNSIHTRLYP